jgi:prepilin-type N-terminal cleavage/methylation domain-containing protein
MRYAFSLIELLIVVLIMGIIYTISVGSFKNIKNKNQKLTLSGLKVYLQNVPHSKNVRLLCGNECLKCSVLSDGKKYDEIKSFLDKSVKSYRYDFSYGMVELEKDNDTCFSYTLNKDGVGEQIFVEFKDKVYDFSSYLGKTPVYDSVADALEAKESLIREVLR